MPLRSIDRATLLGFLRTHRLAVQSSTSDVTGVQSAVVGIAVSDDFEIIFDTVASTRKAGNLARDPRIAFVIGGLIEGEDATIQYEGIADLPSGGELATLQNLYFQTFPDGPSRLAWPGIVYYRVRPRWLRYSDYREDPAVILEWDARQLGQLT